MDADDESSNHKSKPKRSAHTPRTDAASRSPRGLICKNIGELNEGRSSLALATVVQLAEQRLSGKKRRDGGEVQPGQVRVAPALCAPQVAGSIPVGGLPVSILTLWLAFAAMALGLVALVLSTPKPGLE